MRRAAGVPTEATIPKTTKRRGSTSSASAARSVSSGRSREDHSTINHGRPTSTRNAGQLFTSHSRAKRGVAPWIARR